MTDNNTNTNTLPEPTNSTQVHKFVNKVSAKIPQFWPEKPNLWFSQVEAEFHLAGIVCDTTKYSYVIAALDQRTIGEIEDNIINPPVDQKYEKLKKDLISRFSASEEQRVRRLLSDEQLGDRRPSAFLRHLRSLAGSLKDDNLLRQLWMRRLPNQVQAILAAQADLSLDKIAELADKIMELPSASTNVYGIESSPSVLTTLVAQVEHLTKQVAALTSGHSQHRGRSRNRSASRNRSSSKSEKPKMCWYHKKFDTKANRCIPPCSWKENSSSSQ